jgi:hypothetical protein
MADKTNGDGQYKLITQSRHGAKRRKERQRFSEQKNDTKFNHEKHEPHESKAQKEATEPQVDTDAHR